jgi:hypothetical protein
LTSFPVTLAEVEPGRKQVLIVEDWAEIRRSFPYLYDGKELNDTDPERAKLRVAATLVLNIAEYIWERRGDFKEQDDRKAWEACLLSLLKTSPILTDLYIANPQWYPHLTVLRTSEQSIRCNRICILHIRLSAVDV